MEHKADAIGLSGLLVKSTLEMKYVVQDLQEQGLKYPVICGGAALTRKYVEDDLRREYSSSVFYGGDAFDGLHVMEDIACAERRESRLAEGRMVKEFARAVAAGEEGAVSTERSTVVGPAPNIPKPPFWGARVRRDFDLREVFRYVNQTALFKNQWQLKTASQQDYGKLVEEKFKPALQQLQDEIIASGLFEPKAVYGYWPAQSEGNDVIVYDPESLEGCGFSVGRGFDPSPAGRVIDPPHTTSGPFNTGALAPEGLRELLRFTFPRQKEGRKLCIADFFAPKSSGQMDTLGLSLVTIGERASKETARLFEVGEYTRYLYLHGRAWRRLRPWPSTSTNGCARNLASPGTMRRKSATCSTRSTVARAIRLAIPRVRTWKTRPSCSLCSSRKRRLGCA